MTTPHESHSMNPATASDASDPDVTEVVDTLVDRLRAVRATYERQVNAETALAAEREEIDVARRELADRNMELRGLRQEIASQGEAMERTDAQASRRRAALAKLELDIQQRTEDVGSRERQAAEKQKALREERDQLETLKSQVEEDRANLIRRASDLEQREAELTRRAAEAISGEDQAHNRQLLAQYEEERRNLEPKIKEIEASAERTRKELEGRLAELVAQAEQREQEFADKLSKQESLAGRLRNQLQTTTARFRKELAEREIDNTPVMPTFSERVDSPVARRVGLWLAWLTALAFLGLGALRLMVYHESAPMPVLFGLAFGALYFGAHSVGRKLFYPPAVAVGVLGTTAGWWLPAWISACELAATTWDVPLEGLSSAVAANVPVAFAVLSACFVLGLAMLISTNSWAVAIYVTTASVIAAGLVMFPDPTGALRYVAALLWIMLVGTALSQWGMALSEKRATGSVRLA